jgi:excisionase family DNA binding protein
VITAVVAVELDASSRRHLARAVESHRRWCRETGHAFPAQLEEFARFLARNGQERTNLPADSTTVDTPPMAPIALTYREAGALLSVGERTIRRLVDKGELPAITVGGPRTRRIRREDLVAYADSLRQQEAS